jgi:O-antigen ligase
MIAVRRHIEERPFNRLWLPVACIGLAMGLGLATALGQPALPLAGVLMLGLAISMLVWPDTATLTFIFALYMNVPVVAITFYGVPSLVAAASLLLLALPFAAHILRRQPILVAPALPWMLLLLAGAILSAIRSASLTEAMNWISVFMTEGLLLFFLVTNVVRTPRVLVRAIWILLVAGAIMGGLSIVQEATHAYTSNFGGFSRIDGQGVVVSTNPLGNDQRQPRLSGPIGEQNRFAQVLLVLVPLGVGFAVRRPKRHERMIAAGATVLILAGTLLSYSRGAAVALVGVLVLMLLLRFVRLRAVLVASAVVVVGALLIAPGFFTRVASLQGLEALTSDSGSSGADGSIQGRAALNLGAWQAFLEHPLTGVGPGLFAADYSATYASDTGIHHFLSSSQFPAHNLYLGIAADLGLVGLLPFLAILAVTGALLWKERLRWSGVRDDYAYLATAMLLSLAAYLGSGVFLHLAYERYFWFLVAIANATILVLRREAMDAEPQPAASQSAQRA